MKSIETDVMLDKMLMESGKDIVIHSGVSVRSIYTDAG
jgi:hypothetical protein